MQVPMPFSCGKLFQDWILNHRPAAPPQTHAQALHWRGAEGSIFAVPCRIRSGCGMAASWDGILTDVGVLHHQQGCTGSLDGTPSAVDHAARPPPARRRLSPYASCSQVSRLRVSACSFT